MKKPFFIPLNACWFNAFARGEKTIEYRNADSRFSSISENRRITLYYGYGGNRIDCMCIKTEILPIEFAPKEARSIYPAAKEIIAIHLTDFSPLYNPHTQMTTTEPLF